MDKETRGFYLTMVAFVALLYVAFFSFTTYHERVHLQICENFGGNGTIRYYAAGLKGETACDGVNDAFRLDQVQLDSLTEVIGYHLGALIVALFAVALALIFNSRFR